MKPLTEKTVRLLSRSGLVLIFLAMAGSFAMAAFSFSGNVQQQTFKELMGVLFLAVTGIAVYYMSLGFFGWVILKNKNVKAAAAS